MVTSQEEDEGDTRISFQVGLPHTQPVTLDMKASRSMGEVIQILRLMGHAPRSPAFLAAGGRPLPDQVSLQGVYLAFGLHLALCQVGSFDAPHGTLRLAQRGTSRQQLSGITQLPYAAREGVFELTLSIHKGLGGLVDIQAPPDTPVLALMAYTAQLVGISPARVDLCHVDGVSVTDTASQVKHIPGLREWDNLVVHRFLHLRIQVIYHHQGATGSLSSVELTNLAFDIRTNATGLHIWRRISHQLRVCHAARMRPERFLPNRLHVFQPCDLVLQNNEDLWWHEDLPPGVTDIHLVAHFGEDHMTLLQLGADLDQERHRLRQAAHMAMAVQGDMPSTQPWPWQCSPCLRGGTLPEQTAPPPAVDVPPGLPAPGQGHPPSAHEGMSAPTTAGSYDGTAALAHFLDSMVLPCGKYEQALHLAEGRQPGSIVMTHVHSLGTLIFQDWTTLRQVLHTLLYRLDHHCPWRQLGIAKMEGPMPTRDMADMRLFKFQTLMSVPRPTTWTDQDTAHATQAASLLQNAYDEVIRSLPLILQARRRSPTQLAPTSAEVPPHLLYSATAAM